MTEHHRRTWQVRVIGTLWLTYCTYYVGRMNLAVALPVLEGKFGFSTAALGLISSAFYWIYALGQLVNGSLGERLSARRFVFLGMLGTAACNLVFGFSKTLWGMVLFWGINGIFQSTGWGPIVKTAARWTAPHERHTVSAFLGTSFVLGNLASWWLSGRILAWSGRVELVFWVPAAMLALQALFWVSQVRNDPADVGLAAFAGVSSQSGRPLSLSQHLRETLAFVRLPTLTLLAVTTMVQGMIKEGINLWAPAMLMHSQGLDITAAAAYALMIPVMGFLGVVISGFLNKLFGNDERWGITVLFLCGAALSVGVRYCLQSSNTLLFSLAVGSCSLVVNGINALLLSSLPMKYGAAGKSSTLAGYLDFASYLGSACMTIITGAVISLWGWQYVAPLWTTLFLVGGASALVNRNMHHVPAAARQQAEV